MHSTKTNYTFQKQTPQKPNKQITKKPKVDQDKVTQENRETTTPWPFRDGAWQTRVALPDKKKDSSSKVVCIGRNTT